MITIHTDGGARGNPGPAAAGIYIEEKGKIIAAFGKYLGETTNNVAEYSGVVYALEWIIENKIVEAGEIAFFLDSELIVKQLNGIYKIKDAKLRELAFRVHTLESEVGGTITYESIPREKNADADRLVNQILDAQ